MTEQCLLAALVFHPSSSIERFKSKREPDTTTTPQKQKPAKKEQSAPPKPSQKEAKAPPSSTTRTSSHSNEFTELLEGEWPTDIAATMFRSGWPLEKRVVIEKVLKVNHSLDVLIKSEEYREGVKSKFAKICQSEKAQKLMVDGNGLGRFHGAPITCSLGRNGVSLGICSNRWCAVCRIVSSTLLVKEASITLHENSWTAHRNMDRGSIGERASSARTASILCRVIAGRIAN